MRYIGNDFDEYCKSMIMDDPSSNQIGVKAHLNRWGYDMFVWALEMFSIGKALEFKPYFRLLLYESCVTYIDNFDLLF